MFVGPSTPIVLYSGISGSPESACRSVKQHCCNCDFGSFHRCVRIKYLSRGKKQTRQNTLQYCNPRSTYNAPRNAK